MKNGKRPTRKQKEAMEWAGLELDNWLVIKSLPDEIHLVNRHTGHIRTIPA